MTDPYPTLPQIGRLVHPPLGFCMYCDSTEGLTSEHIVPYGLGGRIELPDSTCPRCAKITSKIELKLLRGQFWRARVVTGTQSRSKHSSAPTHTSVVLERAGVPTKLDLPRDDAPAIISFPYFSPPRLATQETAPGISVSGNVAINYGKDPAEIAKEHGATGILFRDETQPYLFAQLLAKIALGMAYATGAIAELKEVSPLRGLILGTDNRIGDYIGSMTDELSAHPGQIHRVAIFVDDRTGYLVADIQLFSQSMSPRYAVVIGSTKGAT